MLGRPLLPMIKRVNAARRQNPALQHLSNITRFWRRERLPLPYLKRTEDNVVVCVLNLDPHQAQKGLTVIPAHVGLPPVFPVSDLLGRQRYEWRIRAKIRGPGARGPAGTPPRGAVVSGPPTTELRIVPQRPSGPDPERREERPGNGSSKLTRSGSRRRFMRSIRGFFDNDDGMGTSAA